MKREMKSQRRWNIPSPGSPYSGLSQAGPGQMTAGQSPPILVLELGPPNGHGSGQFGTEVKSMFNPDVHHHNHKLCSFSWLLPVALGLLSLQFRGLEVGAVGI